MVVIVGEVVGDAGEPGMHIGAAQLLRGDVFARRGFDERWAAQEDRAGTLDDHGLVRHRGHIRAACRARAHHDGDLWKSCRRHARLIEEDPAKMVPIRKDLGLHRQERAARVDQIHRREPIVERHLLRA